jgi:hypothetical protein
MIPPLSMREAARRAGFSVATWTQIEQGHRKVTAAVTITVRGTDEKIARMAVVAGATPAQLADAGRPEAARMLEKLIDAGPDIQTQTIEAVRQSGDFSDQQKRHLIDLLKRESR